jgi:hypothetical protein
MRYWPTGVAGTEVALAQLPQFGGVEDRKSRT